MSYVDKLREKDLNDGQIRFIVSPVSSASLLGVPGCGKSTAIAEYVIHKKELNILKDKEIFCVCFGKQAQESLLKKMKGFNMVGYVRTFDSLCEEFLNKNNLGMTRPPNYDILSDDKKTMFHNEIRRKCKIFMEDIHTNIDFWKGLKLIIVDEAQDMNSIDFNIINCIRKKLNNVHLILIGDPNQCIFSSMRLSSAKYLLSHDKNVYMLENNYRSTPEIVKFSEYFQNMKNSMISSSNFTGPLPKYFTSNCYINTDNHIIKFIKESISNGTEPKNIVILTTKREQNSNFGKLFKRKGIDIKYNNFNNNIKNPKNGVNLMTYWKAKGLEWDIVICYDFHNDFRTESKLMNNIKFVGVTRAKKELYIYYNSISTKKYNGRILLNKECSIIDTIPEELYEREDI